jgi:hypothetical protein
MGGGAAATAAGEGLPSTGSGAAAHARERPAGRGPEGWGLCFAPFGGLLFSWLSTIVIVFNS